MIFFSKFRAKSLYMIEKKVYFYKKQSFNNKFEHKNNTDVLQSKLL